MEQDFLKPDTLALEWIEGDSLVVRVALIGSTQPSGVLVARAREGRSLAARLRTDGAPSPLDLTLIRER